MSNQLSCEFTRLIPATPYHHPLFDSFLVSAVQILYCVSKLPTSLWLIPSVESSSLSTNGEHFKSSNVHFHSPVLKHFHVTFILSKDIHAHVFVSDFQTCVASLQTLYSSYTEYTVTAISVCPPKSQHFPLQTWFPFLS